jgi:hypothetical protein
MPQPNDLSRSLVALNQDITLSLRQDSNARGWISHFGFEHVFPLRLSAVRLGSSAFAVEGRAGVSRRNQSAVVPNKCRVRIDRNSGHDRADQIDARILRSPTWSTALGS